MFLGLARSFVHANRVADGRRGIFYHRLSYTVAFSHFCPPSYDVSFFFFFFFFIKLREMKNVKNVPLRVEGCCARCVYSARVCMRMYMYV